MELDAKEPRKFQGPPGRRNSFWQFLPFTARLRPKAAMELDAKEPRKFQGPPDRILGSRHGSGGGQWVAEILGGEEVGEGKAKIPFRKRDLSALGPHGAEANWFTAFTTQTRVEKPVSR